MTPTFLFRKSYLARVSPCCSANRTQRYSLLVPVRRMEEFALVFVQSRDLGPRYLIELAPGRYDKVYVVLLECLSSVGLLHLDSPLLGCRIPRTSEHLVLRLDEAHGAKLFCHALEVPLDFSPRPPPHIMSATIPSNWHTPLTWILVQPPARR
ncbi:hypothetical protein N8I77_003265 [Diaporthe amygdali]|uniref:Uncharacterized protein n=1 Tax=Phomopsis amygdali TaxID=1214568 RepID=A0AAD9SHL9_PHOAM|nr:hypothetical protein N8I77_003265 [Diaporthe amygdali]